MLVQVINGPNLNLLGTREPEIYGSETLDELEERVRHWATRMGVDVEFIQSNDEGEIVSCLQDSSADGIVINPGALSHTSRAIADAVSSIGPPVVEVHISNIKQREEWRSTSVISDAAVMTIYGRGITGYRDAIRHLLNRAQFSFDAVPYGPHRDQTGEIRAGGGELIILIHGGIFRDAFQRDTMESLAVDLTQRGNDTWNIGYRRLGSGGGWPASAQDVATAFSFAASPWGLNRGEATVISHSAGGYLAMWASARTDLRIRHLALAPMSDLAAAVERKDVCAPEAAEMLAMGAPAQVGTGAIDTVVVHGDADQIVDVGDSRRLMESRSEDFITGTFGHFELLDPRHDIWDTLRARI